MKQNLFITLLALLFTVGLGVESYACDYSPSVNANNIVDNGDGTYSFDVLMCIGERGSENGPVIFMSDGINIISTSAPELVSPTTGNVAVANITGGVITYDFAGAAYWETDDDEFGPCLAFTLTVDSDPTAATVSFENINDGCLNEFSGVWDTTILSGGTCVADQSIIAPAAISGNTNGAGNDCDYRPSDDHTIEVEILCEGIYTFSTCDTTAVWDTWLYLSASCCDGMIVQNDDFCGAQSQITTYLPAGTYYLTIEGYGATTDGAFTVDIISGEPPYKAETSPDQSICETSTIIMGNPPVIGTGSWSVLTGSGEIVHPDSASTEVVNLSNGINQFIWTLGESPCATSSDTITVIAAGNLMITCPAEVISVAEPGECSATVNYDLPEASSECSPVTITPIDVLGPGAEFPVGTTLEQYLVEDTLGNADSCFVVITVIDDEPPVISCPENISVNNDAGECFAVVDFTEPQGTDNCPDATTALISGIPAGEQFPIGTTTNIYEVTDASGNSNVCMVEITVTDAESPVFDSCPDDIEVNIDEGECDAVVNYDLPTASDNCPGLSAAILVDGFAPGATFPVGNTTVTYEVTDASGNVAQCSFTVTVLEPLLPEITCPDDLVFDVSDGLCGHIVNYIPPVGIDNCPGFSTELIEGLGTGMFFPVGTTIEVYEVTDASGNVATCSFTITVNDTILPQITCPADIVVDNDAGLCGADVDFTAPTGTDNCDDVTVTLVTPLGPGDFFPVGTTNVGYIVEDAAGNISSCSFNVTVNDIESPQPVCSDMTVSTDPGECHAVVEYELPTATDNCDDEDIVVTLLSGQGPGGTFPLGSNEEIYSFEDASGNIEVCTITITVEDDEDPEIVCPDDQVIILDEADCTTEVNYVVPVGTDNCGGITTSHVSGPLPGELVPAGEHTIVYQAEDAEGNIFTCDFTITVVETVDPTISCPSDILAYSDPLSCGAVVNYTAPVGEDNCPGEITTQTDGLGSGEIFPVGTTTETYLVTDLSGNIASCSFIVTVLDTISPEINCPVDIEVASDSQECTAIVNYDQPTASDNCDDDITITLIDGPVSGSEFPVGVTTIVFEAEDESGNTTTCSFTITVTGESEPEITCPEDIVIASLADSCGTFVEYPTPEAFDACGGDVTLTLDEGLESGAFFPIGTTTIGYTATNTLGNSVSCSFNITVVDEDAPVITCPEDIELTADGDICEFVVNYDIPTATDNCSVDEINLVDGDPSGSTFGIGNHTITYEAVDAAGNTSQCSFNIIITDVVDPTISGCPDDITVNATEGECGAVVNYEEPVGDDNCDFDISHNGFGSGAMFPVGETTVTWTVIDLSGNTASCSFTVTVVDNIAPTVDCEDIVTCESVVNWSVNASDNCGVESIEVTEGPESGSQFPIGTTTVSVLVSDAAGNTVSCSFDVTVEENPDAAYAGPDQFLCTNTTQLEANDPQNGTGSWEFVSGNGDISSILDPNATLSNLETGTVVLIWTVEGSGSCPSTSDSVTIIVNEGGTVDAGENVTIQPGGSTDLEATTTATDGSFSWFPENGLSCTNCPNPEASPNATTTYTVTYTTADGCEFSDQVTVTVISDIPTGFTPGNDGTNDYWNIPNVTPDTEVKIYNRWGNLIFESVGYNEPWDGTYNNTPLPMATYYYVIDYRDDSEPLNGTITLIR